MSLQMQTQMHYGFLICVCLVGFTAAKCVPERCGSMDVSYPFWINNSDCGHPDFKLTCRESTLPGMQEKHPYFVAYRGDSTDDILGGYYYKVMNIDYEGHLFRNSSMIKVRSCKSNKIKRNYFQLPLDGPFTLSKSNKLVVIGCGTFSSYSYGKLGEARCVSICDSQSDKPYCRYGCCEINLPNNWPWINYTVGGEFQSSSDTISRCGLSTIMDPSTFTIVDNKTNLFRGKGRKAYYGLILNWGIGLENCSEVKATGNYSCSSNAECLDSPSGTGHVCRCLPGYEGNGYFNGTGCTDREECTDERLNKCVGKEGGGICHNLAGSYNCSCARGYVGDGFTNGTGCISTSSNRLVFAAIIGSVSSFVVVSLAASLLVWRLKKRHLKLVEAKYYQQLPQHIASTVGRESLRIFSAKELARACNNYSKEMVLGSGGFGTVFKGILPDDTVVAIKKSNQAINLEDDHEFLNETTILSQINHRNIVKLLGCCIQTKFPLLVSEFVPNGTLFEHLHSKERILSWASRLQIAIETGEALAYLHSGASQPIFHRDTYQLTEKSDVYSFGVVLVELLTALKPICVERASHEWSLSSLFLSRLNSNRFTEIFDSKVLEEENMQQMEDMARIAREGLRFERRKRPSMKEVVEELICVRDGTRKTKFHDSVVCEDAIFDQKCISRESSQMSYEFRSYSFPCTVDSTSEEPSTALIQMSNLAV
ncbi:hypothetical protein SUGI_0454540 [Cryptomeria japonica]|nr:hypothetical protein SUGI_0454540 [Cryptomeria japonica]